MRTLALSRVALLACALAGAARADEPACHRLVEVLPARTFGKGSHRVTLTPLAPAVGQWFVTASGNGPGWVEIDGKVVVSPADLAGPRRDRETVAVLLRATSRLEVRVPGQPHQLTVRVFGIAPASALPAGAGKPVGDVVVFDQRLSGGLPSRHFRQTVDAPGADGVLFLSATQAGHPSVLLGRVLWNDEAVLGPVALGQHGGSATAPVIARESNTLEAWALGSPGSAMQVRLHGWVVDEVAPTAAWESPLEGAPVDAGTAVRLTWSDAGTGVASERTKIFLNGNDVTAAFTLGTSSATATVGALPPAALVSGVNVLRATVTDRACNAVTVERRFSAGPSDTVPPVVSPVADLTVEQQSAAGAVVSFPTPTATDDQDPAPVVTCTPASGSTFPPGATTVTCTARDAAGNTSAPVTFVVVIRDTTAPVFAATPEDIVVEQASPTGTVVSYTTPAVTDVDPSVDVVCEPASGSLFQAGPTTVTCTATDNAGNVATTTFQIVVRDTTPPVLEVLTDLVIEQTGPTGAVVTYAPPAVTDAGDAAVEVACAPASGSLFPAGATTVTCTAQDAVGNTSAVTFVITVRDTTAPVFTATPEDVVVEQASPTGTVVSYATPAASDPVDSSVDVVCEPASGSLFQAGSTTVTCTATDDAGNVATTTFQIVVRDTTPPVLEALTDLVVEQTGPTGAVVTYAPPAVTDAGDAAVEVACVPASGSLFPAGATTVTCTARDAAGNTSAPVTFVVVVRDTTAPIFAAAPEDVVVEQASPTGTVVSYATPAASDPVDPSVDVVCEPASGSLFQAGSTTVTCTATDEAGNVATLTFHVVVRDTTPPAFELLTDLVVEQAGPTGSIVTYALPAATDAVDAAVDVACVPASGSLFRGGATTVICTATDDAGNVATTTFLVRVLDRIAPTFDPYLDVVVEQDGPTGSIVAYPLPTATDAVDPSVQVECAPASGSLFAPGVTVVECRATDTAGNIGVSLFTVRVIDRTAPAVAVVEPTAGTTVGPAHLLRVTFSDAVGVEASSLQVFAQGRDVTDLLTRDGDSAQANLGALGLAEGDALVEVRARDQAGNEGVASSSFTFVVPPVATRLVIEIPPAPAAPLQAGQTYDLTLRALTATGDVAATFTGLVLLRTTDPTSRLNDLVVDFDASHAGVRTVQGIADFATPGPHTVTAEVVVGPAIEGQLDLEVERSERGRVLVVLPSGSYLPGQVLSARVYVDAGPSDGDPSTFADTLGAYDLRLLYDRRQVEVLRVDAGASALGPPLFVLPGSVRLMDLNDLGTLRAPVGPDPTATGLVEVASIDLRVRPDAPSGTVAIAVVGDALTTAEAATPEFRLSSVGPAGPRPGVVEGSITVESGRPPVAGPVVLGVSPRDTDGLVEGAQAVQDLWVLLSAPVDPSTLDEVTLSLGGTSVPGVARLGDDAAQVRFTPASPLGAGEYTLDIGAGLASLQGVPIGQPVQTTFRVGPAPSPRPSDLDQDGELAVLDLQVRRDVKTGRTPGTVPDFPPVFLKGAPGKVDVPTAVGAEVELEVVDLEGGTVTFDTTDLPPFARLERTGTDGFLLTLAGTAGGTIDLVASNANGDQTVAPLEANPERRNNAPEVRIVRVTRDGEPASVTPPLFVLEGTYLQVEVLAVDLDLADLTYPDHLAFLPDEFAFVEPLGTTSSGAVAVYWFYADYDTAGLQTLDIRVRDDSGAEAALAVPIVVFDQNRRPEFTVELPATSTVPAGSVTFEWVAEDPDGSPVEVALTEEGRARVEADTASGAFTFSVTSSPGRLQVVATPQGDDAYQLSLSAVASDLVNMSFSHRSVSHAGTSGPPPTPKPRFELRNGASLPFPRDSMPMFRQYVLDDPETPENEASADASGTISFVNVGAGGAVSSVELEGLVGEVYWNANLRIIIITLDPIPPALSDGGSLEATLAFVVGGERFRTPITLVDGGRNGDDFTYAAPTLISMTDTSKGVGRMVIEVAHVERVRALRFVTGGFAQFVLVSEPPTAATTGDFVLEFAVLFAPVVTSNAQMTVEYWVPDGRVSSPALVIPLTQGTHVTEPGLLAHFGEGGVLEQVQAAPILPAGARAEDQPVTPDNPYVVFLVAPDTGRSYDAIRGRLELTDGTPGIIIALPSGGPMPVRLSNGHVTSEFVRSLPIFFTFRSEPAASLTPIRVLADRIVVSIGAHEGFDGGSELVPSYPLPGRVHPGAFFAGNDDPDVRATVELLSAGALVSAWPTNITTFVPGIVIREPGEDYPFPTQGAGRRLVDGTGVWCNETIEVWDPWINRGRVFLDVRGQDDIEGIAQLTPFLPNLPLQHFPVHEFMEREPGFAPGSNRLRLFVGDDALFDVTFELLVASRALAAKTGPGLDVDFSCAGAFPGDAAQAAYRQGDLALDDGDGPGVTKVGASVLIATGEEVLDRVDLVIPGRNGLDFKLSRRYRNQLHYRGPLGYGWDFNWNDKVHRADNGNVDRQNGNSRVATWEFIDPFFYPPEGHFGRLVQKGIDLILRMPDGTKHYFSNHDGILTKIENRQGDAIKIFYNKKRDQIDYILDVFGRRIEFTYETREVTDEAGTHQTDLLVNITDFAGRQVDYVYNGRGDLIEVHGPALQGESPNRRVERYTYTSGFETGFNPFGYGDQGDLNHNLKTVTSPEEVARGGPATLTFEYGEDPEDLYTRDKVVSEVVGGTNASGVPAGGTRSFEYLPFEYAPMNSDLLVRIREPNGSVHHHFIDSRRRLDMAVRILRDASDGGRPYNETRTYYTVHGLVSLKIHPEGNVESFHYDTGDRGGQRNLIRHERYAGPRGADQSLLITTYTYEPLFNQLSTMTDSRAFAPEHRASSGTTSQERYTTKLFYDYQEGDGGLDDAGNFNIPVDQVWRNKGDLNDDLQTGQQKGNCVRIESATVHVAPGGLEPAGTVQLVVTEQQWSEQGALLASISPVGVLTEYHYFHAFNPGGSPGSSPSGDNGGYLARKIVDAGFTSRRSADLPSPLQISTRYRYNAFGSLVEMINPRGVKTEFEVNAAGETTQIVRDAGGLHLVTTQRHDANGRLVETRSPGDEVTTTFTYDILGSLVRSRIVGPAMPALTTELRYDENQNQVLSISPEGNKVQTVYDERNLPVEVTRGFESADASTAKVAYDGNGNAVSTIDGLQRVTAFEYDGHDRLRKSTDPLGNETTLKRDPMGKVVQRLVKGHPAGDPGAALVELASSTIEYDELSRPFKVTESVFGPGRPTETLTIRTGYDAASRVVYRFDDGETEHQVTTTRYDGASRPVGMTDPVGNVVTVVYDPNGNTTETTSIEPSPLLDTAPSYRAQAFFDALDRLVRTIDPAGHTRELTYDARDNLVVETDAEGVTYVDADGLTVNQPGNSRSLTYDGLDRLIRDVRHLRVGGVGAGGVDLSNPSNPDGQITVAYTYDGDSRLTSIKDDRNQVTAFGYDGLSRRKTTTMADGKVYHATYDDADNLKTTTDPNLTTITREYDALNRVESLTATRGQGVVGTTRQEFKYDGLSRLTSAFDNNVGVTGGPSGELCEWVYDSLGRVLTETQNTRAVTSTWSKDGRRASLRYPGGRQLTFVHDQLDRVVAIREGMTELTRTDWIGPGYRPLKRRNANGTELRFTALGSNRGYDAVQRVTDVRWYQGSSISSPFLHREYTYNRASMRTSEVRHDDAQLTDRVTYDSAYRIARTGYGQASGPDLEVSYRLDGVGNRHEVQSSVAAVFSVNSLNQYTSVNGTIRTHDANGNLTGDGERSYFYDAFDRLVWVIRTQDSQAIAHYTYLADGRRSRAEVWDPDTRALQKDVRYVYDGPQEIEEVSAGATTASYVWGPEYVDCLVQVTLPTGSYFVHQDGRWNVVALTDALTGVVAEKRRFDDFGQQEIVGGGPGRGLAYGFQGRRHDDETGLCYFRARYYDPGLGRFLTRDPVLDAGNFGNQYTFAGNNPTSMVDPSGRWLEDLAFAVPSIIAGSQSLGTNLGKGDFGWAALDALGLVLDVAALMLPGIPGGAGTAIQIGRAIHTADRVADGWRLANLTLQGGGLGLHAFAEADDAGMFGEGGDDEEDPEDLGNCFLAGTLVVAGQRQADGTIERTMKPIENMQPDDPVWSEDPKTGWRGWGVVKQVFRNETDHVAYLAHRPIKQQGRSEGHRVGVNRGPGSEDGEDGEPPPDGPAPSQMIRCTPAHPWWSEDRQAFVPTKTLRVGERLRLEDGSLSVVLSLVVKAERARTFNFEVAQGAHTYFVAGAQDQPGVLVHNTSPGGLIARFRRLARLPVFNQSQGATGTVAFVQGTGRRFFGVNSKFSPASLALRRTAFAYIKSTPAGAKVADRTFNLVQSTLHGEGHALFRAWRAGAIEKKMTIWVDRALCGNCIGSEGLDMLRRAFAIEELTVRQLGNGVPRVFR